LAINFEFYKIWKTGKENFSQGEKRNVYNLKDPTGIPTLLVHTFDPLCTRSHVALYVQVLYFMHFYAAHSLWPDLKFFVKNKNTHLPEKS